MESNTSVYDLWEDGLGNPLSYRIIATILHVVIFIFGVVGNVTLIVVVHRTKSLHKPTYCYLISLAYADLTVLLSAMPEAIMAHHIGFRWVLGQFGCSLLVFGNFVGINAGSLSLLIFTFERYVAVVHPMLAQKVCTVDRANKIIVGAWILAILYCCPWLGLTVIREDEGGALVCDFRLSAEQYSSFFAVDIALFYLIPLIVATLGYVRIAAKLRESDAQRQTICRSHSHRHLNSDVSQRSTAKNSSKHALKLLLIVTIVFAVCWLPYRGLLFFNTFLGEPWLNIWYLLFSKTLIYINSSINPFLYSFVNKQLRQAVRHCFFTRKSALSKIARV